MNVGWVGGRAKTCTRVSKLGRMRQVVDRTEGSGSRVRKFPLSMLRGEKGESCRRQMLAIASRGGKCHRVLKM